MRIRIFDARRQEKSRSCRPQYRFLIHNRCVRERSNIGARGSGIMGWVTWMKPWQRFLRRAFDGIVSSLHD